MTRTRKSHDDECVVCTHVYAYVRLSVVVFFILASAVLCLLLFINIQQIGAEFYQALDFA